MTYTVMIIDYDTMWHVCTEWTLQNLTEDMTLSATVVTCVSSNFLPPSKLH